MSLVLKVPPVVKLLPALLTALSVEAMFLPASRVTVLTEFDY
jgi:hypothetical protein